MSRGFDSFDLDDFRHFLSPSEKPPRRKYPEEREQKRRADGSSNSKTPCELPINSLADDLRDANRNVYPDREHIYSLCNSEIDTLIETGKFRVVDTDDLAKFAYAGDHRRMDKDISNLTQHGLVEQRNTSVLKKDSRRVLALTKQGHRYIRRQNSCRENKLDITVS